MKSLDLLFHPSSVVIIGASGNASKVGGQIFLNALQSNLKNIIPVNPKHHKINNLKSYSSVLDYPHKIDIAVIAVKAEIVPAVLSECGQKQIPFAIIISSGFKEAGVEGQKLENKISQIQKQSGIRLLGPNCLGMITPKINLSFGPGINQSGRLAVISQSGAIGSAMIDWLNQKRVGINHFVSLGNKTDLSENDFLENAINNKNINAVFIYLESFAKGYEFFNLARAGSFKKPIITLKPGISRSGLRAMTSHTGALISDAVAYQTALNQANIINAENLEDFFYLMKYYSSYKNKIILINKNCTPHIITNAGGVGVLLADMLNIEPNDIGGAAGPTEYKAAFSKISKNCTALFCVITPQEITPIAQICQEIVNFQKKVPYPIFIVLPGGNKIVKGREIIERANLMFFDFPEDAVRIFNKLAGYYQACKINKKSKLFLISKPRIKQKPEFLNVFAAQKLAHEYNLPVNDEYLIDGLNNLKIILKKINFPLVLKIHGEKFIHKTEKQGVRLNIDNIAKLGKAYQELNAIKNSSDIITVSKQIEKSFEVIIGVKKDPDFGHLLMFGMGGIYTEIMKDISYGLLPLADEQIVELIIKTKTYQIINGARNLPKLDIKGIIQTIKNLNRMIVENPWIEELDINPLLVGTNFVKIVDLKIK